MDLCLHALIFCSYYSSPPISRELLQRSYSNRKKGSPLFGPLGRAF